MFTTNRQSREFRILLASVATTLVVAALPSISHADSWELRTVSEEVPGTREIESGNPEKAIRLSKIHLSTTSGNLKVAVLTNLCIGHILIRDFEQAEDYCDKAAARPNERTVTFNNRGVLKALQGDYVAAQNDFAIAANTGCRDGCVEIDGTPKDLPRPVARRNLEKADTVLASRSEH